jgi:hypothetical protein
MEEKCCYNILMNFLGEEKVKTREDKRMVKPGFYGGYILKKSAHSFFGCMVGPLGLHSVYT